MEQEKVIHFACEAGFGGNQRNTLLVKLMAFAHRVERAEREACAKICEDNCAGYSYGRETQGPCLTEFPKEGGGRHDGMTYAAAIRMRSNV